MTLQEWLYEAGRKRGIGARAMYDRCRAAGRWPKMRRKNGRVVTVIGGDVLLPSDPQPGEVPLKQWLADRAVHLGISYHAMQERFYSSGARQSLRVRKLNSRVIFVKEVA